MKKQMDFLIKLTYDKSFKGYVTEVVNLYGCMSQGKTKAEALKNTEKAIKAFLKVITSKPASGSEFTSKRIDTYLPVLNG